MAESLRLRQRVELLQAISTTFVQKTVGDVVYNYYYADGLLVRQTWGNNYIDFLYDESGIFSFVYNGTQYYYIKNLQGDVVAIANAAGHDPR